MNTSLNIIRLKTIYDLYNDNFKILVYLSI